MEAFKEITSLAIPFTMPNVDTDVIAPMKRLILVPDKLGDYAFESYRYVDGDGDKGIPNPGFILNQPAFGSAQIMITGKNFGCGSSREAAPDALRQCGIRCLIGSSFADIFYNNCFQQGILPVVLPEDTIARLEKLAFEKAVFNVSLEPAMIRLEDGTTIPFAVDPIKKEALLKGMDLVDMTMVYRMEIEEYFRADRDVKPWVYCVRG